MNDENARLKAAVDRFRRAHRWEAAKLAAVRVVWLALVLGLAVLYLDVLLAYEDGPRLWIDLGLGAVLAAVAVATYRTLTRSGSADRMVARLVERSHPELENDLVNALDFEKRLEEGPPRDLSQDLMQEEIAVAAAKVSALDGDRTPLRPSTWRAERYAAAGAFGAWVAAALLFPGVLGVVLPRYLDPLGDRPPYSATRLDLDPAGARVYYGEDVTVSARIAGKQPDRVWLVIRDRKGVETAALPMYAAGDRAYAQQIQGVTEDAEFFARVDGGRSRRHALTVIRTPRIESASVTYAPPAYTGLGEETRSLGDDKALEGYVGTQITLTLTSNRPLKGGTATVCGREIVLDPAGDKAVQAQFPLTEPGTFRVRIADVDGVESRETLEGRIAIRPDEKPRIAFVHPGMDSFAVPDAKVPVTVEAGDDLGVRDLRLYRNFNGSRDAEKLLWAAEAAEPFAHATDVLDLADLGVRPGDVIDYYATATDTRPGAPQTAATQAFRLQIVSFEEYRDFMQSQLTAEDLTQKYGEMLDRVEAVAREQERLRDEVDRLTRALEDRGALDVADQDALREALAAQEALADRAEALAASLHEESIKPGVFDVEEDYKRVLSDVAHRLEESAQAMRGSGADLQEARQQAAGDPGDPGAARQSMAAAGAGQQRALEALGQGQKAFEEGVMSPSREIESVYALMQDVENFKHLYARQKGLERQAHSLQDAAASDLDKRIRMKEVAKEQEEVRDALGQLGQDLDDHAKGLGDRYPQVAEDARAIVNEIAERGIPDTMGAASESLARGEGKAGHRAAGQARQQMEEMIEFCEAAAGSGRSECEARLRIQMPSGIGNTLGQMSKSMGSGVGGMGYAGRGQSGMAGGTSPFGMFGNETFGDRSRDPGGRVRHLADTVRHDPDPSRRAARVEELAEPQSEGIVYDVGGGERFIDEYRGLINRYFKGLAEEEP